MTASFYKKAVATSATLQTRAKTSKAVRRKLLRKLCSDLNFQADTWELANKQETVLQLAVSRVAYGSLTVKQKKFASKLLTY